MMFLPNLILILSVNKKLVTVSISINMDSPKIRFDQALQTICDLHQHMGDFDSQIIMRSACQNFASGSTWNQWDYRIHHNFIFIHQKNYLNLISSKNLPESTWIGKNFHYIQIEFKPLMRTLGPSQSRFGGKWTGKRCISSCLSTDKWGFNMIYNLIFHMNQWYSIIFINIQK